MLSWKQFEMITGIKIFRKAQNSKNKFSTLQNLKITKFRSMNCLRKRRISAKIYLAEASGR